MGLAAEPISESEGHVKKTLRTSGRDGEMENLKDNWSDIEQSYLIKVDVKRIPEGKRTIREERKEIIERLMTENCSEKGKDIRPYTDRLNRVQNRIDKRCGAQQVVIKIYR